MRFNSFDYLFFAVLVISLFFALPYKVRRFNAGYGGYVRLSVPPR